MCQPVAVADARSVDKTPAGGTDATELSRADGRREDIRRAAVQQFMAQGFRATSMANIAAAAGVSRPALYQYFSDKDDIFAAAFAKVFEERVDAALEVLDTASGIREALDGMLQRYEGDLWDLMWSSPHHVELLEAKSAVVLQAITVELDRLWSATAAYLEAQVPGRGKRRTELRTDWLDMLRWSPRGLKIDEPSVDAYRRRLQALARSLAAEITTELESGTD